MSLKSESNKDTLLEFSITPLGVGGGVSSFVADVTKVIRASNLENELHSMGTIVEGTLDECLDLVKQCVRETLQSAPRASVAIKIDVRSGANGGRIRSKVNTVRKMLGDT